MIIQQRMWRCCVQLPALHRKHRNCKKAANVPSGCLCFFMCISFFSPAGMKFITMCSCLDKPPWGSFHASSDLKLLTSSHHANEVSGRAEQLYTTARYHCWQTAYTSIMLKMGVFNLRGNTLLKVLFSLKSTYNVYQSFMHLKQS